MSEARVKELLKGINRHDVNRGNIEEVINLVDHLGKKLTDFEEYDEEKFQALADWSAKVDRVVDRKTEKFMVIEYSSNISPYEIYSAGFGGGNVGDHHFGRSRGFIRSIKVFSNKRDARIAAVDFVLRSGFFQLITVKVLVSQNDSFDTEEDSNFHLDGDIVRSRIGKVLRLLQDKDELDFHTTISSYEFFASINPEYREEVEAILLADTVKE